MKQVYGHMPNSTVIGQSKYKHSPCLLEFYVTDKPLYIFAEQLRSDRKHPINLFYVCQIDMTLMTNINTIKAFIVVRYMSYSHVVSKWPCLFISLFSIKYIYTSSI